MWPAPQLRFAEVGVEVGLATDDVDTRGVDPPHVQHRWRSSYVAADGHPHVHGPNVGCRADAYTGAGGFLALSSDEALAVAVRPPRGPSKRGALFEHLEQLAGSGEIPTADEPRRALDVERVLSPVLELGEGR